MLASLVSDLQLYRVVLRCIVKFCWRKASQDTSLSFSENGGVQTSGGRSLTPRTEESLTGQTVRGDLVRALRFAGKIPSVLSRCHCHPLVTLSRMADRRLLRGRLHSLKTLTCSA